MKTVARILLLYIVLGVDVVRGDAILTDDLVAFGNYVIVDNMTVANGVWFEAHNIVISDSLDITNFGEIRGTVEISENCTMALENSGVFDADVIIHTGAKFIQVISSDASATNIGLNGGYDVRVQNGCGLTFDRVMNVAANADAIEFNNVNINAGRISDYTVLSNITLHGNNTLVFDDVPNGDMLLFSDISGGGAVYADSAALDSLHILQTFVVDDDVFMRLVRSTDYARILNNDMGRFLNSLRANGNDSKLFLKLDSAQTIDDINKILSQSVRTNPIKLLQPMQLVYRQKTLETMHIDDVTIFGIEPLIIYSPDVLISGISPNVYFNIFDKLHMELSGYILNIDYSDDINDYGGVSYGIGVNSQYDLSGKDFLRLYTNINKSWFDVGPVFNNGRIVNNPDGITLHMSGEYAHTFTISDEYSLSPFVFMGGEYMNMSGLDDTHVFIGGGMDVGYKYEFDGLQYDYKLRILTQTDGAIGFGFNASVWSGLDAAGADVHIGAIYDDCFGLSWHASINGRFGF